MVTTFPSRSAKCRNTFFVDRQNGKVQVASFALFGSRIPRFNYIVIMPRISLHHCLVCAYGASHLLRCKLPRLLSVSSGKNSSDSANTTSPLRFIPFVTANGSFTPYMALKRQRDGKWKNQRRRNAGGLERETAWVDSERQDDGGPPTLPRPGQCLEASVRSRVGGLKLAMGKRTSTPPPPATPPHHRPPFPLPSRPL